MKHIVVASSSFKDSLDAVRVGEVVREGIHFVDESIRVSVVPVADGGDGTLSAFQHSSKIELKSVLVHSPLNRQITAHYGVLQDSELVGHKNTVVVEVAQACGLSLLSPGERNPLHTSTFGVGEIIASALGQRNPAVEQIVVTLGGSSTNDCGIGMAQALGYEFYDANDIFIDKFATGKDLIRICKIKSDNIHPRIADVRFMVACDVTNPLTGDRGASRTYGPQKGASQADVEELELGMQHFKKVLEKTFVFNKYDANGAGAAGGLGAGLMYFCAADYVSGFEWISQTIGLNQLLEKDGDVDLVITNEGRVDDTTAFGKGPIGVSQLASKYKVPTVIVCGSYTASDFSLLSSKGVTAVFPIVPGPCTLQEALTNAAENLRQTVSQIIRIFLAANTKQKR